MSGRKLVISPFVLVKDQDISSGYTSTATTMTYQDNIAYQVDFTNPTGTGEIAFEGRIQDNSGQKNVTMAWVPLDDLITPIVINSSSVSNIIDIQQLSVSEIRLVIRETSNLTGTATITLMAKTLGA